MIAEEKRGHVARLVGGLSALETAQRLERLARQRYGAYGFDPTTIHVRAVTHGFVLIIGDLTAVYRTAIACEQMIMEFGTPPLTQKSERAPS